ncbi:hypothetical protein C2G38_2153308 [Gigaspora rosea]|uniref:Uncharacterized protein n=1 Tax=Gigaspora rosea TaxID=44941 RepID=A0A397W6A9_9GLOM|nr:hypothetical protein C2G38_2153308 [Gigaspora rosea]
MQQKKKFLPSGKGESTEDEEDKGKHVRRTKSPINILDAETSQATSEATHEATPEATQEELPEGSSTTSAGYLAIHDEPQEGSSTNIASAGHLATHDA